MAIILGIDPGSRITGYGLIRSIGNREEYVASGCISTRDQADLPGRLDVIFQGLSEIIREYMPAELAIEKVFMARSPDAALKLGHARGAAMVAAVSEGLPVYEYEARKVKQAVVGTGAASKAQVQQMVMKLLKLSSSPQADAADALAIALCHSSTQHNLARMAKGSSVPSRINRYSRGRLRQGGSR